MCTEIVELKEEEGVLEKLEGLLDKFNGIGFVPKNKISKVGEMPNESM